MENLPRGTVTFLFTDIEGSTKLWQQFPDAMPAALARHHDILRRAIEAHNGYVFQIIGDAFCAAFGTALDGLNAALVAQRALRDFEWSETGAIRVRMALHTGAAEVRAGDFTSGEYVSGITLSRAARLLSAGHGGQILLSEPTEILIQEESLSTTTLRDMGAHRLKDLVQPIQIFQVLTTDLPQDFPRLKTLDALPNNLPIQLTSFIGRERELEEIKTRLRKARVLTLMGAGGSGKTRLSLQVAADLVDEFEKGAWFVDLSPITDPSLVPSTVLSALELRADASTTPLDALTDYLRAKKLLLVLDNCEHLIEACARFAQHLLTHCPGLKILATSREALGIAGEVTYQVPTLALPDPKHLPSLESLSQYDAVKLFIERATAVQPNFSVTNANAPAVAQICFRLDGIPLALELAAARIKIFSPEQIASRLDDRFRLLASGSRTAMPRQQTLRGAIDWSFSLLSEQERVLFRRLSVFTGGWTFEAAESVCAGDEIDALDILELLAHLVDKSLVIAALQGEEIRYRMLETIREYAFEKLREANESDEMRDKHLDYFVAFAERAEPELKRAQQLAWFERLEADHDNLRAALNQTHGTRQTEKGLRLIASLVRYWDARSKWREGSDHLEKLLRQPDSDAGTLLRAKALLAGGIFYEFLGEARLLTSYFQEAIKLARALGDEGRYVRAEALAWYSEFDSNFDVRQARIQEGLESARSLDDDWLVGLLFFFYGHVYRSRKDYTDARKMYETGFAHFNSYGDAYWADVAAFQASLIYAREGNYPRAREHIEASLPALRLQKQRDMVAFKVASLGDIARLENDYALARRCYVEGIEIAREIGLRGVLLGLCGGLGFVALHDGDKKEARTLFAESFVLSKSLEREVTTAFVLTQLASLAAVENNSRRAVQLFAFGNGVFADSANGYLEPIDETEFARYLALARDQLTAQEFTAAWEEGRALTLELAIELAGEIANR